MVRSVECGGCKVGGCGGLIGGRLELIGFVEGGVGDAVGCLGEVGDALMVEY